MRFEKLTKSQLKILKSQGYTLLTSNQKLTEAQVFWFPERVADVMEYLVAMYTSAKTLPFKEQNLLFIDDALENIKEEDLIGEVFL